MPGMIFLAVPHGQAIWNGDEDMFLVAKPDDRFLREDNLLGSGALAYGRIQVGVPLELTREQADRMTNRHGVLPAEREERFGDAEPLWGYPVVSFERFEPPREFVPPANPGSYIEEPEGIVGETETSKRAIDYGILKRDDEKRVITSVVLEPNVVDAQGHWETAATIEAAAFDFLSKTVRGAAGPDEMHDKVPLDDLVGRLEIVESWIAKVDQVWEVGVEGVAEPVPIQAGTWMMTMRVLDDDLWARVQAGELQGFSIQGRGTLTDSDGPTL